jgi:hypothetical protein
MQRLNSDSRCPRPPALPFLVLSGRRIALRTNINCVGF